MRFKIDENLPIEAADLFRRAGHEADTVDDEGLSGASDDRVAQRIRNEQRTLVTLDLDFANLRRYSPSNYPGLIVIRLRNQNRNACLQAIERVIGRLERQELTGKLWRVDETTIRVHD